MPLSISQLVVVCLSLSRHDSIRPYNFNHHQNQHKFITQNLNLTLWAFSSHYTRAHIYTMYSYAWMGLCHILDKRFYFFLLSFGFSSAPYVNPKITISHLCEVAAAATTQTNLMFNFIHYSMLPHTITTTNDDDMRSSERGTTVVCFWHLTHKKILFFFLVSFFVSLRPMRVRDFRSVSLSIGTG